MIAGRRPLQDAVRPTELENLWVLPAGTPLCASMAAQPATSVEQLFAELALDFSFVVVDLPPIDRFDETLGIWSAVDGVLVVIEAECTGRTMARAATQSIAPDRLLGAVLNKLPNTIPPSTAIRSLI